MKILIVAGEASGDLHGSHLSKAMLEMDNSIQLYGVGGRQMEKAGVNLYFSIEKTAIIGLVEIIGKVFFFIRLYNFLISKIKTGNFDAVILIDYPTLNLRLAQHAKKKGIPAFYFISPQVWAWKKERVKQIKRDVTRMMVILPFEKNFYQENGVVVDFVGHPFVDVVKPTMTKKEALEKLGVDPHKKIIGLFPGSRSHEVSSHLPILCKTIPLIKDKLPDVQFILALSDTLDREKVEQHLKKTEEKIKIMEGTNYDVMNIADFLIVASGSVTLEISFFEVPMVIIYKANPVTFYIAKKFVKVNHIGLVNIVGQETIVPELIQSDVTPEKIAAEVYKILKNTDRYNYIQKRLKEVKESLGKQGACKRAAEIVVQYFKK